MERRRPAARWLEIRDGLPFAIALVSLDEHWWLAECGPGESIYTPSRPIDRDNYTGLPAAVRALLREIDGDRPCQPRAARADCTALSDVFSCRTQSRATHLPEEGEVRAEP